ncbi:hypothetical protein BJ123_13310 [Rhodopseudomonas thermotolerans]|uniref:Uncharacterized protein n=2 Tax=Rhodopseudomonas TaxID=1073 RepID=A0A336JUT1_9BRAD|nr:MULTISPECIES: hypothetical protein [Rhodopseudomonas]RED24222.1 hypothetical protein BJ125_13311 [Rhodopseudomonas pentothenatexigens]REF90284.1 hypothetical protein BJ123_13310 [Rhodopseudomonas thermotolerans]SSW93232.1 hypothetical protein SAMN05892882_13311 [Rhodopseudomonas pentothenatexigens]
MDEHRNEPIGEQQTGPAAAAEGAQSAASRDDSSAADHATPANSHAATDAAKPDAGQSEADAAAGGSRPRPGTVTIMAPSRREDLYRHWDDEIEVEAPDEASQSAAHRFGLRKLAAVAAAVILAAIAGAVGGALATAGLSQRSDADTTAASAQVKTLDTQVAQLQTELSALKADLDRAAKQSSAQLGKTADRIEKLEKAQAEPAAKLAKLTETVEKLRTAQAQPAATPAPANVAAVAAKDVTGSIAPKPEPAKSQPGRLPTIDGWVLRDVYDGGAVVEGRSGTYEVYAGDPLPGVGRVDAIRRQDGRWVVVTSRGLIVSR